MDATYNTPKTCTVCGATDGTVVAKPAPEVNDIVILGGYEQDNNWANGQESIQWIVLDVQGDYALLLSRYALDAYPYHSEWEDITWEDSDIRQWLNYDFFFTAFSGPEQNVIMTTNVNNSKSHGYSGYSTSGGKNTLDQIFLLSYAEVEYYFYNEQSRVCQSTHYAAAQAKEQISNAYNGTQGYCWWWLRSPGDNPKSAMTIFSDGEHKLDVVENPTGCVRPAMWVNLESFLPAE